MNNHNQFCGSPEIWTPPLRTSSGEFFIKKDLRQGILGAVIAVNILVILSIIAVGGCQ